VQADVEGEAANEGEEVSNSIVMASFLWRTMLEVTFFPNILTVLWVLAIDII
jgi:hypothetical protein